MAYRGRTRFRSSRGLLYFFIALSIIVFAISLASTTNESELWVQATCWVMFGLSVVAIADLILSYVILDENEMRMRRNFRTRRIPRVDIDSVSVAKGCPITLHLVDGSRVEVPDIGTRGLDNSIRAWIRATQ